ncbi:MAG: hypothetical protein K8S18_18975 [Desulfobacula sp.]|nr:hypothetical protein [Desulfobacula sp.]
MPDRFVTINKDGFIIGGKNIPFTRDQNLFNYVTSRCGITVLKRAMKKASETIPQDVEINFRHLDKRGRYFCRIYKYNGQYLIGGWKLPQNILYFPHSGTAA